MKQKINRAKQSKQYREKNADKIKEKITCDCGSEFRKADKARHLLTKKHRTYVESLK